MKARILLVEDDPNLSTVLQDYLEILKYKVTSCKDGQEGISVFQAGHYDLCILDVMMPKKDGFTLAREIRHIDEKVPIIFLTAKSLKEDRLKGFKTGCDDYITKPFSTEELSLRIEAILRRCQTMDGPHPPPPAKPVYNLGGFRFDPANMLLISRDTKRILTRKETALLKLLCEHKNEIITREYALKTIWGEDDYFIGRSMDVFIVKLRKYLSSDPSLSIKNIHGTGFRLEENSREKA